nr:trafficking protein particle complex subunit 2 [Ipomoea batatas]
MVIGKRAVAELQVWGFEETKGMASTACFMIVSRNDIPIYEAEVGTAPKKEDAAHQHQFILHAALDIVQDLAWTTSAMFLKAIDRFNDLAVSVYVTAGHILHIIQLTGWMQNIEF